MQLDEVRVGQAAPIPRRKKTGSGRHAAIYLDLKDYSGSHRSRRRLRFDSLVLVENHLTRPPRGHVLAQLIPIVSPTVVTRHVVFVHGLRRTDDPRDKAGEGRDWWCG
jgi:hypothetical protein